MNEREAASAPAAAEDSRNLLVRVAAALVLAPVGVAAAWVGGWWWVALVTLAAIGLYVEWLSVTCPVRSVPVMVTGAVALALAAPFLAAARVEAALAVLAIGLVVVSLRTSQARLWVVAGYLYAALAQLSSVVVRLDPAQGLAALILVLLVVWGTDIGGYFAGRGIGGPRLWPRVSPKKTWAGSIGGFVASLLVATGFTLAGYGKPLPLLVLAAALSIAAQLGDLLESAVKRRFGVKDSSHIIPGHGGLMDRLDGFVAAIVLAAIFGALRGGVDGVGRALMVW